MRIKWSIILLLSKLILLIQYFVLIQPLRLLLSILRLLQIDIVLNVNQDIVDGLASEGLDSLIPYGYSIRGIHRVELEIAQLRQLQQLTQHYLERLLFLEDRQLIDLIHPIPEQAHFSANVRTIDIIQKCMM